MLSVERKQSVQTPVYYRLEHRAGNLLGYIRLKEFNAVAKRDMVTGNANLPFCNRKEANCISVPSSSNVLCFASVISILFYMQPWTSSQQQVLLPFC